MAPTPAAWPSTPEEAREWIRKYVAELERQARLGPTTKRARYVLAAFRGLLTGEYKTLDEAFGVKRGRGAPKLPADPAEIELATRAIKRLRELWQEHRLAGKRGRFRPPYQQLAFEFKYKQGDGSADAYERAGRELWELCDKHWLEVIADLIRKEPLRPPKWSPLTFIPNK